VIGTLRFLQCPFLVHRLGSSCQPWWRWQIRLRPALPHGHTRSDRNHRPGDKTRFEARRVRSLAQVLLVHSGRNGALNRSLALRHHACNDVCTTSTSKQVCGACALVNTKVSVETPYLVAWLC